MPFWVALGLSALAYFLTAELGLAFASEFKAVSPVWPASGLAVAIVRQFGIRLWPGIAAGAFAANALVLGPGPALVIAAGNTLEAVVGGTILRRLIEQQSDSFILARTLGYMLAAGIATVISATMGVGALCFSGTVGASAAFEAWLTWWTGDALGVLLVTSTLLALRTGFGTVASRWRAGQALGCAVAILLVLAVICQSDEAESAIFLAFPVVFLASRWFGPRGSTWTALAFSIGLIAETVSGIGPFTGGTLNGELLDMQVFLAVLALAALVFVDLHALDLRTAGAVFMASAAIAAFASLLEHREQQELESLRFHQLTELAAERIRERTAIYSNALRSAASLYEVSKDLTSSEWREFATSLALAERYPGITGLGIVVPVKPGDIDRFVAAQQARGAPDFAIKTVPGVTDLRAADEERFIIQFMEPAADNVAALGADIGSEASRRQAALDARDSGLPVISAPIVLRSDPRHRLGFHFYLPVYDVPTPLRSLDLRRVHFRGWVLARFVTQDFFESALMPLGDVIIAEIFDGDIVAADRLLTSTWDTWNAAPREGGHRAVMALPLAGHLFTFQWYAGPGFAQHGDRVTIVTGSVVVLLATLLAALVANLQSLRQRAIAIAERMTGELAATNERFELAIAGSTDGIWDWDLSTRKLWGSPRCWQMLGYDETTLSNDPVAWRALLLPGTERRRASPSTASEVERRRISTLSSATDTRTAASSICTTRPSPYAMAKDASPGWSAR